MSALAAVEPISQSRYAPHMASTIGTRIQEILDHYEWSGRELDRRAEITPGHSLALVREFAANPDHSIQTKTLRAIARGAKVSLSWLQHGLGEPGWGERHENSEEPSATPPEGAPGPPLHDNPPATVVHLANYDAIERVAKRGERDIDQWVWDYLRVSNPFRDGRYPLTPASLKTLAKAIAEHGLPPANTKK